MRSVQARHPEATPANPFEDLPAKEQLERNRKLAALIRKWQKDTTGHDVEFWPVLKAELERRDD